MRTEQSSQWLTSAGSDICRPGAGSDICRPGAGNPGVVKPGVISAARHALNGFASAVLGLNSTSSQVAQKSCEEIDLVRGEIWSGCIKADAVLECREGTLWVTSSGDAHDYLLRAGEMLCLSRRARVVVSAISVSAVGRISRTN